MIRQCGATTNVWYYDLINLFVSDFQSICIISFVINIKIGCDIFDKFSPTKQYSMHLSCYQCGAPNRRRQAGANAGEETDR
jgi:hypothetical protein